MNITQITVKQFAELFNCMAWQMRPRSDGEEFTASEAQNEVYATNEVYTTIITPAAANVNRLEKAIAELDSMTAEIRRGCARDERLRKVIHDMYEETDKAYLDSLVNGENTNELWARRETLRELMCRAEGEGEAG